MDFGKTLLRGFEKVNFYSIMLEKKEARKYARALPVVGESGFVESYKIK